MIDSASDATDDFLGESISADFDKFPGLQRVVIR
jgi:hypothetical protein